MYRTPTGSIILNGKMLEVFKITSKTRMSTIIVSFQRDERKDIKIKREEIKSLLFTYMSLYRNPKTIYIKINRNKRIC